MSANAEGRHGWSWRCLQCRGALTAQGPGFGCADCGTEYPVISGIPILVREPQEYLRAELAGLKRVSREARQRRGLLEILRSEAGLPQASIDRHRDIIDAEIARADLFLTLLEPAISAQAADIRRSPGGRGSGWTLEALVPFLLRDWTHTTELDGIKDRDWRRAAGRSWRSDRNIGGFPGWARADCWRGWRRNSVRRWGSI